MGFVYKAAFQHLTFCQKHCATFTNKYEMQESKKNNQWNEKDW